MLKNKRYIVLPIGDCHVSDDESNLERFELLSKFIVDKKPDYIIIMGDFLTLNCLSNWDKNKRAKMENKRYKKEIDIGNKVLDIIFSDLKQLQSKQKKQKIKQYKPKLVYLEGNHENRLTRYLEYDPTFEGFISIRKDLCLDKRGIEYISYGEYYYINGIGFTHIPFNSSREISGVDITKKASMVIVDSCVFAHTHRLEMSNYHKQGQKHLQQIVTCGCFFEKHEDYVKNKLTRYWKGLILIDNWKYSRFDYATYAISKLKRMYG